MSSTKAPMAPSQVLDADLISRCLTGDREAAEALVDRHQSWIYNIAFRMVMVPEDAKDVTQEILIKMLTKLATYDPTKAAFRTWLYRIAANHVINMRKRGYESAIGDFDTYYSFVAAIPDETPDGSPETGMVIKDLAIGCTIGVLLCLGRQQRLAFILAIGFNISDTQGSEILGVSKDAFRKMLSRARLKLKQYMNGNCGLVNPDAPCRCRNKVTGFMKGGAYGPDTLNFVQPEGPRVEEVAETLIDRFDQEVYAEYATLFQGHPFYQPGETTSWLKDLLKKQEFRDILHLN